MKIIPGLVINDLDLQLYHHGEDIAVNVHIANNSNRSVKKIKVTGTCAPFSPLC